MTQAAIDVVTKELEDVRKKLKEYDDLKAKEARLEAALAALEGKAPASSKSAKPTTGRCNTPRWCTQFCRSAPRPAPRHTTLSFSKA